MEPKEVNRHRRTGAEVDDGSGGRHRCGRTALRPHRLAQRRGGKTQTSNQRRRGKQTSHSSRSASTQARNQLRVILPNPASSGATPPVFTSEILKKAPTSIRQSAQSSEGGKQKPKLRREEVRALYRQAPEGHVTGAKSFAPSPPPYPELRYGFLQIAALN